jgi:polysaccharide biosynthesis transport protein
MNDHSSNNSQSATGAKLVPAAASRLPAHPGYGSGNPYGPASDISETARFNPQDYLRVVYKRKWLILICFSLATMYGLLQILTTIPLYTSHVRMQIDRATVKVVEGGSTSPTEGDDGDFLRTQYELILSRGMASRVVSIARVADDVEFFKPRTISLTQFVKQMIFGKVAPPVSGERSNRERAAVDRVMNGRGVRPVNGSRLVDIMFTDPDPVIAQRVAAAFGEAVVASNLDKRFQANAFAKTFLEDQLKQLKLKLEGSEKTMLDFAERSQMVVTTEKASIAENNLSSANSALGAIIGDRIRAEQQWHQVSEVSAVNLPQFLTNAVIAGLRDRKNSLVTEYQEKLETFKPNYPTMVQISQKISEIDKQIVNEVKTIKMSLKGSFEAAQQQEANMKSRIDGLRSEVLDLQKQMVQFGFLKREVDTTRTLYDQMLQRFKEVDIAGGVGANNMFIVDAPETPGSPSNNASRALLLQCAMGLGLGLAAAFALERLDDTVRSPEDAELATKLPTLGIIPRIELDLAAALDDPRSAASEAYRSLCTSLQFATDTGLPRTLLVTSAGPSEGKSFTAIAIARHFAALGMKVLLVDSDLRNPSLHKKLQLENSIGLSNYLAGAITPPEAMQKTSVATLAFIPSGPPPPNAADLLASARLHSLLQVGLEIFDLVVVDGPPVMGLADAPLLSNVCAGTIFVVGAGQARAAHIRGALRRLQMANGNVLGSVVTKFDPRGAGYGYGAGSSYGYGYGYGYGGKAYGQDGKGAPRHDAKHLTAPKEPA